MTSTFTSMRPWTLTTRLCCLVAISCVIVFTWGCGTGDGSESASEVRTAALEYTNALESMTDALESLVDEAAGTPVVLSELLSLQRGVVNTGRQQLNEYSDEVLLGEPFLNRMDDVIAEVNSSIQETQTLWDRIRRNNQSQRFDQLLDALDRAEERVIAAGVNWDVFRRSLDQ